MDNAQKAIMIGVGLFITIIVIAAVMLITGIGQDLLNSGTNQLTGISESLRTQMAEQYDGKTFTLSQVTTACSDLISRNDSSIKIVVNAGDNKKYTFSDTATNDANGSSYTQEVKKSMTNFNTLKQHMGASTQKYVGSVDISDSTGIITVTFTKQ